MGDRVRVQTDGGSAAAHKYAGREGCVTKIAPGFDKIDFFVRIDGNHGLETVFEERDLKKLDCGRA